MVARSLAAIVWIGSAFARLHAAPLPDDGPPRGPIDADTIAAYERFGGEYGGFRIDQFRGMVFTPGKEAATKQLPGFRFSFLPNDGRSKVLPAVRVQFGLDFHKTKLTDVELANMKKLGTLSSLNLAGTQGPRHEREG